MALANINSTYNIDPGFIISKDPNYRYTVQNQVNAWYSKSGVSASGRTAIPISQADALARIINTDINAVVAVGLQLVTLINSYIKNSQAAKTFVMANSIKYNNVALQWNGRTMMSYLVQNQAMIEAAGIMQSQLAGRLPRKII